MTKSVSPDYTEAMVRGNRNFKWVFILLALMACGIGFYRYHGFYHDDSYISLRYAHNFLAGHGLVWNPGERVEGYTNFWFVIMVSFLGLFKLDLVLATRLIGLASFVGLLAFVWKFDSRSSEDIESGGFAETIPFVLTATALPLIVWSVAGLESVMFSLFVTAGLWLTAKSFAGHRRYAILAGYMLAMAALTRPEGVLFFAIAVMFVILLGRVRRQFDWRGLLGLTASFGVLYAPGLLWRLFYYGELVPNTWHLKGEFSPVKVMRGLDYLYDYTLALPYVLPLLVATLIFLTIRRSWNAETAFIATALTIYLLYVIYVGGDHMQAFRFLAPVIPSVGLLIVAAMRAGRVAATGKMSLIVAVLVTALACLQAVVPPARVNRAHIVDGAAFMGEVVGKYIAANWPNGSLIALNTAGSTPYYAPNHRFIDMLGLNDKTIARLPLAPRIARHQLLPGHEKGDADYVLARRPDYIIAGPSTGDLVGNNWFLTEAQLAQSGEFFAAYRDTTVAISVKHLPNFEKYSQSRDGFVYLVYYQRL